MAEAVRELAHRSLHEAMDVDSQSDSVAALLTLLGQYRRISSGFSPGSANQVEDMLLGQELASVQLRDADVEMVLDLLEERLRTFPGVTRNLSLLASASEHPKAVPLLVLLLGRLSDLPAEDHDGLGACQLLGALEASAPAVVAHPWIQRFSSQDGEVGEYARYLASLAEGPA